MGIQKDIFFHGDTFHTRLDKTALFAVGKPQLKARPDFYDYIIWHSSKGIQNLEREQLPEVFHTKPE